jgi:methyl-accepting chemotaxis protein
MRNNQPITNSEYLVPKGQILVSKTDLAGTIIECNDAFETSSGYSRAELIGQPHNMIRHPDVPAAVFADMWADLKNGSPWSQCVKNRRKDGGYYWVRAHATPIYKQGQISGFMSVRTSIEEEEKRATAQAYQDIAAGQAKIKHGRVYSGLSFFKHVSHLAAWLTSNLIGCDTCINWVGFSSIYAELVVTRFQWSVISRPCCLWHAVKNQY